MLCTASSSTGVKSLRMMILVMDKDDFTLFCGLLLLHVSPRVIAATGQCVMYTAMCHVHCNASCILQCSSKGGDTIVQAYMRDRRSMHVLQKHCKDGAAGV